MSRRMRVLLLFCVLPSLALGQVTQEEKIRYAESQLDQVRAQRESLRSGGVSSDGRTGAELDKAESLWRRRLTQLGATPPSEERTPSSSQERTAGPAASPVARPSAGQNKAPAATPEAAREKLSQDHVAQPSDPKKSPIGSMGAGWAKMDAAKQEAASMAAGVPLLRGGKKAAPAEPGPDSSPAAPRTMKDLRFASMMGFAESFEQAGLKLMPGHASDGPILRMDGTRATPEDLERLRARIMAEPRALMRFQSFFKTLPRSAHAEIKKLVQGGRGGKDFKDIVLSSDSRDLLYSRSCARLSGDCNPHADAALYAQGEFVSPETLGKALESLNAPAPAPEPPPDSSAKGENLVLKWIREKLYGRRLMQGAPGPGDSGMAVNAAGREGFAGAGTSGGGRGGIGVAPLLSGDNPVGDIFGSDEQAAAPELALLTQQRAEDSLWWLWALGALLAGIVFWLWVERQQEQ